MAMQPINQNVPLVEKVLVKAGNAQMCADVLSAHANRIGMDVTYASVTPADGNCFYHGIVEQIHRQENITLIEPHLRFTDHFSLRLAVVSYVRRNEFHNQAIQNYKDWHYNQNEIGWQQLITDQGTSGEYANQLFCQCTSDLFNAQLRITTMMSTVQHPYYTLKADATSGAIFILANITEYHFQSLLPTNDRIIDFQIGTSTKERKRTLSESPKQRKKLFKEKKTLSPRIKETSRKPKKERSEKDHEQMCQENDIAYLPPQENETLEERKQRTNCLNKKVYKKKLNEKQNERRQKKRTELKEQKFKEKLVDFDATCRGNETYDRPRKDKVNLHNPTEPLSTVKRLIKNRKYYVKKNKNTSEIPEVDAAVVPEVGDPLQHVHPNPKVASSIRKFEDGEEKHTVATCTVCKETRPVFFTSYDNNTTQVKSIPWKINKDGICKRCKTDRTKRAKKGTLPAKFSGHLSAEEDLGPEQDQFRHNNQHFLPVPPYLQNLSAVELALISKITVCMNIHMLRFGMLAAKGHSISIPQRMAIATKLPQLPENVGIIVLRRKGSNQSTKHYTVKRSKVEDAIKGLCYGAPIGGLSNWKLGTQEYTGPDHVKKPLKGRYFYHLPNQYYHDVEIQNDRINNLPADEIQFPELKVIDLDKDIPEQDKGPSPEQFQVPFSENDESVTTSGITLPMEPKDADQELRSIIQKLTGDGNTDGQFAVAQWDYADDEPLSELRTSGFFAMAFPGIFINASCDITHNQLVKLEFDQWVEHIYFQGDGRITKHPYLKFFLYNLGLRKKALQQGNFLVAQQLNESHISIDELKERIEGNDDSIPRKIIKMAANLPNTDPYWYNRRQELEAFTFYRRKENGDLPAYFHTNSMAELHWTPLIDLMAKYLSATTGKDEADLKETFSSNTQLYRKAVLENLHLATLYFDARSKNYYETICKELFGVTDYFYRYEFAKSRGQIHTHGLLFSESHAKKVEQALDLENHDIDDLERAKQLYQWLQTDSKNGDGVYSPTFTSLHPAGGEEKENDLGGSTWIPNKEGWPLPEGTQQPPEFNPLKQKVTEMCTSEDTTNTFHTYLTNRVALHQCNGYCLRKKQRDSKTRHCRVHFGQEDPDTKKTSGKEIHPFDPWITGSSHPRYEGPRDHPRLVMHSKPHLLTWLGNADTQALIDQDLLNLQKYIVAYACKGASSTEELITIYKHLLDSSDSSASVKNVVHRLLMKLVGMIDVPAAAVDYLNSGGKLYHSTRHVRRVGLSGYRQLNQRGGDENITKETFLDKFLSDKRRAEHPNMNLWDWTMRCDCRTKCLHNHVPLYTGGAIKPVWPLSEDCCKYNLMIFARGTWRKPEDLKAEGATYSEAFAEFLDTDDCNPALKEMVALSKKKYEKKVEKDRRKAAAVNGNNNQSSQPPQSQGTDTDSQMTFDSQDSTVQDLRLGQALLRDIRDQNKAHFDKIADEEEILHTGGDDFNWHDYAVESLGFQWNDDVKTWIKDISKQTEERVLEYADHLNLPDINLLFANPLQRLIIGINIQKLLEVAQNGFHPDFEPLRLLIQGTAGTGKTFVITAISQIVRRIFRRNGSVMNLAPTGSAANLLPDGRTVHSTLPPLRKSKKNDYKTAQMTDHPLSHKALSKLKRIIGSKEDGNHQLQCLNMDERSMFSNRLLAWSSQRLCEATGDYDHSFGSVPIVNFFGDLGQLGPVDAKDLHTQPVKNSAPDELAGYSIYRQFDNCVVLSQTMRQNPEQKALLERLLRLRNGSIIQQDWIDINARYENDLPSNERDQFQHDRVITLHETWAEVMRENRKRLSKLNIPVAIIPSTGRGRHHRQEEKQMGQIMAKSLLAVGSRIILTKNQGSLTQFGLNNGAMGKVVAILYAEGTAPPTMPEAVICDFPAYKGTAWINNQPTWIPIVPNDTRDDTNCCSRRGMPLMPGYSIPVAKSQGMTVGDGKSSTHMRIKIQADKFMEAVSLGTTYTAFSRVESESRWCLVEKVPADRILYVNIHPHMECRREEETRLLALSARTVEKYSQYMDENLYVRLLQELDEYCNDGFTSSCCQNPSNKCPCILCKQPVD